MKLEVMNLGNKYYIVIEYEASKTVVGTSTFFINIRNKLKINEEDYVEILKNNNCVACNNTFKYYFKTQEDAESAIVDLEPYLIMAKLTGEWNEF